MQDSPQSILVVEDEEDMAVLLRRALERRGFRVDLAGNGTEALAALATRHYALLITDIFIPRMNGLRLAEAARQRSESTRLNSSHIQKSRMPSSA